jgi:hypothetical protein
MKTAEKCNHSKRKIGLEMDFGRMRRDGSWYRNVAQAINSGEFGFAVANPNFQGEDLARALLAGIRGGAQGYSAQGFPMAAGGVDVSQALMSVRPGVRKIKKLILSQNVVANQNEVIIGLPNSGYLEQPIIRIAGLGANSGFQVIQGGTAQAITVGDIRNLVQRLRFELSSTVVPKSLAGIEADVIDNLDVAVINANANTVPTSGAMSGIAGSTTYGNFVLELCPRFTISDQNLYGIPYLGAKSTTPQVVVDFAPLLGPAYGSPLTAAAAGPTAALANVVIYVDGWRVDLPAPVAPSTTVDANGNAVTVPGEGLWAESSYLFTTKLQKSLVGVGPGQQTPMDIPIGPMYARIILMAYVDGILDTESGTAPQSMLDHAELSVQEATIIESRYPWQYDSDYRKMYYKNRPKGIYVHSGIDATGTDEDLYVTQDLGNFQITPFASANADGNAQTKFNLITQGLQPISTPGLYA